MSTNNRRVILTASLCAFALSGALACSASEEGAAAQGADMEGAMTDANGGDVGVKGDSGQMESPETGMTAADGDSASTADTSPSSSTDANDANSDGTSTSADEPRPGTLELVCISNCDAASDEAIATLVEPLQPGQIRQAQTAINDFNMGDIRASQEFLFLLVNPGDTDVVDLELTSDSDLFTIKPSTIDRLPPQSEAYVLPIIRVAALHGVAVEGVGTIDLMPMGPNSATVAVAGQSEALDDNSAMTDVGFEAMVSVDAKVMDIELYDGTTLVDLTDPSGSSSTNLGGLGFERFYYISSEASLTNTGNVDIEVIFYDLYDTPMAANDPLAPNDELAVPASATTVALKSNTVTDGSRLQLGNDGVAYFRLEQSNPATDEGKPPEEPPLP